MAKPDELTVDIRVRPEDVDHPEKIQEQLLAQTGGKAASFTHHRIIHRSIDARKKPVVFQLRVLLSNKPEIVSGSPSPRVFKEPDSGKRVAIIGAGPAGLFAALKLLEMGVQPVVFERGKDVRSRRRDLAAINRDHIVNPESNYCFGEGGAGTYSDGKLYTRSKKRGDVRAVLETLVQFGAHPDILVDAHPHIGTNKLPDIITAMRETIIQHGGEVHFGAKLTGLVVEGGNIRGLEINQSDSHRFDHVILATGHSARDIFRLLHKQGITVEAKPFALGVRIEHPQEVIDNMQYRCSTRPETLPPASYAWTAQHDGRGIYSFCMCPGGIIAPCATAQEEVVTNGWSPSKRNNPFANSGVVVSILPQDWQPWKDAGPLAALEYQSAVERSAWEAGGKRQSAPAQRLKDYFNRKTSSDLPECSYKPGIVPYDLRQVLPAKVAAALENGLRDTVRKMPPYLHRDAVMVGVESRTSSPVRIPRLPDTLQHPEVAGLYPCGEGAGYAGGIVSAAMDGERCALVCAEILSGR